MLCMSIFKASCPRHILIEVVEVHAHKQGQERLSPSVGLHYIFSNAIQQRKSHSWTRVQVKDTEVILKRVWIQGRQEGWAATQSIHLGFHTIEKNLSYNRTDPNNTPAPSTQTPNLLCSQKGRTAGGSQEKTKASERRESSGSFY